MRPINILSVCGSGTVSSAMLTSKLTDILEENGYEVEATEVAPGGVELAVQTAQRYLWHLIGLEHLQRLLLERDLKLLHRLWKVER